MGAEDVKEDIYLRFEREVRTPGRPLLLDAFLPPAEAIPSAFTPPPPPPAVEAVALPGFDEPLSLRDLDPDPPEPPRPTVRRKRAAPAPPPKAERQKSLEEEIEEFMNRDKRGPAPDDDLSSFATSLDPNLDPESGSGTDSGSGTNSGSGSET